MLTEAQAAAPAIIQSAEAATFQQARQLSWKEIKSLPPRASGATVDVSATRVADIYGIPIVVPRGGDARQLLDSLRCLLDISKDLSLCVIHDTDDHGTIQNLMHAQGVLLDIAAAATNAVDVSGED